MTETRSISLDFYHLDDIADIVDNAQELTLDGEVQECIGRGADYIASIAGEDRHIYGINTGFGSLCVRRIEEHEQSELQHRHLLSHACGVGEPMPARISRITTVIKLLTFRSGYCGITPNTVNRMLDFWARGIVPAIPKKGTVGASGDLAPLAHLALPLIGEGKVYYRGELVDAATMLAGEGFEPLRLRPKEGLALTNGVQYINAIAVDCLLRARTLIRFADLVTALSIQGFSTAKSFYQPLLEKTWRHPERVTVAKNLETLLAGSNHHELPQCNIAHEDPYSYRCVPQVHAAARQAINFATQIIEQECNTVSDNPVFFYEEGTELCAGNLHGASSAMVMDLLAIALTDLSSISERRTYQLLSGQHGLPDYLVAKPGLDSGLMIPQYTSAALVNENKVLSAPASVDTIATCQLQEDHVSMGGTSAYKLMQVIDNLTYILGIELLTAAQAIDLNEGLRLSPETAKLFNEFRSEVSHLDQDRYQHPDIEKARQFVEQRARRWCDELAVQ
ncbi:aromatic amino acid ammonia-lyase [Arthrobacter sp. SLBN-53]|uniref:HAL/PAL/TAL family ammonia-lyase n=1 Tax=Arthrobacter sp. SLBN-53 TaxID=2768412 RepID=UPI00115048E3|nr:aromatic amino acid ammonia-lyase [Arthrobacter sp. SLBN-53]TQK28767.1 histidine ammonia-lyase [Arthrobacter sp. SLBN-53]